MPIPIKHRASGSVAEQLEAQRRLMQEQSRLAFHEQQAEIEAQKQLQYQEDAAKRQQAYDDWRAQLQWEYKYTPKQQQEIARYNQAKSDLTSGGIFTPEEQQAGLAHLDSLISNIQPSLVPSDPSKFKWPDGTGPGMVWRDQQSGSLVTGLMDKDGQPQIKLIQRWDQSPQSQQMSEQARLDQMQLETQQKREDAILKLRTTLATQQVDEFDETGYSTGKRNRTPEEIEKLIQTIMGSPQLQDTQQAGERSGNWWDSPEAKELTVKEEDKELPPQIGEALATARTLYARFKRVKSLPETERTKYMQAIKILKAYTESQQQGQ